MPNYRLYRIHPDSGHFMGVEEIHAPDDGSAMNEARQHVDGNSVELWEGGRKVTRIDPMRDGPALAPSPEKRLYSSAVKSLAVR